MRCRGETGEAAERPGQGEWSREGLVLTVQLESHRRYSYRKRGEQPVLTPRPKHPNKLHVWARRGATPIEGTMNADLYIHLHLMEQFIPLYLILIHTDLCSISTHPGQHNSFLKKKTPPESPDANPIENLWHEH